jgi:hypothetical protein
MQRGTACKLKSNFLRGKSLFAVKNAPASPGIKARRVEARARKTVFSVSSRMIMTAPF